MSSSLIDIANEVRDRLKKADEFTIAYAQKADDELKAAGRLLDEAFRRIVKAKELGEKVTFKGWLSENALVGERHARRLIAIIKNKTPEEQSEALDNHRANHAATMRAKRAADSRESAADAPTQTKTNPDPAPDPVKLSPCEVPYDEQPAVMRAAKALAALDYNQRIFVWKHVLPLFDPAGPKAPRRKPQND